MCIAGCVCVVVVPLSASPGYATLGCKRLPIGSLWYLLYRGAVVEEFVVVDRIHNGCSKCAGHRQRSGYWF
jgi:hypothetical protein